MLPNDVKPYKLLSFDETLPQFKDKSNVKDKAYEEGFNLGKQKGYEEGYKQGYEEGLKKGYTEGLKSAEFEIKQKINQLENTVQTLINLIEELQSFKEKEFKNLLPQIISFALNVAKKVVSFKISTDKEVILSIVKEALQSLPISDEKILIKLNPEDYKVVSENIEKLGINKSSIFIEPSELIRKGEYLIETSSQYIESTIQDRFKEIEDAVNSILP